MTISRHRWQGATRIVLGLLVLGAATACSTIQSPLDTSGLSLSSTPLYGKFVWHDLMTEDPAAVKRFYAGLLGWEYHDATAFNKPYTLVKANGQYVAGIVKVRRPDPEKPVSQWISYLSVPDVDAAVGTTADKGGETVAAARDIPNIGRAAVVTDPEGAPLGLLHSDIGDPDDSTGNARGQFLWMELLADDPVVAAAFYQALAGYEVEEVEIGGGPYRVLRRGVERAGVLKNPVKGAAPIWLPYVVVEDPVSAVDKVRELGGRVLLAPKPEVRKGTLALVEDPSGAVLALQKWPL
ncbi:MAG: VOC family protein [Pseudomonadota bacterium]|nr:VOC family protein [Pseudomonadota bacterium]